MSSTSESVAAMKSSVVKRSIVIAGHKTSVSLEDAFWKAFKEIADQRHVTISELAEAIDSRRQHSNLSSALRLFVLDFYRDQLSEQLDVVVSRRAGAYRAAAATQKRSACRSNERPACESPHSRSGSRLHRCDSPCLAGCGWWGTPRSHIRSARP